MCISDNRGEGLGTTVPENDGVPSHHVKATKQHKRRAQGRTGSSDLHKTTSDASRTTTTAGTTGSTGVTGGSLLDILGGKLKSTSASALLGLDPTIIATAQNVLNMNGGALTLAGPLLTDTNGTAEPGSTIMKSDKLFMADQDQWFGPLRRRPHA